MNGPIGAARDSERRAAGGPAALERLAAARRPPTRCAERDGEPPENPTDVDDVDDGDDADPLCPECGGDGLDLGGGPCLECDGSGRLEV